MVSHRFNRVQPCNAHPALLPKPELTLDLTEQALKIQPWKKLFYSKNAGLEFISAILLKMNSTTRIIRHGFYKVPFLIFWKTFFEASLLFLLHRKLYSTERTRTSQLGYGLDIYKRVTGNVYISMPMPMPLPMPRCRCRDFQMSFYQFIGDHLHCRTFKWLLLNLQR